MKELMPKECLTNTTSVKHIEPPKGKISSKSALALELRIKDGIAQNRAMEQKSIEQLKNVILK